MSQVDAVLAQMAELTNAVKGAPKQELQWEQIEKNFGGQIDALVQQQVKAALDRNPRSAPQGGAPIAHDGTTKAGRYARAPQVVRAGPAAQAAGMVYSPPTC